jgi:NTP pyrophosphatase (non-canonical NTP hydrolase)
MTFSDYQKKAATTALYLERLQAEFPDLPDKVIKLMGIMYAGLGLGESGETQNVIKKMIRDDVDIVEEKRKIVRKEIGDILWYCAAVCTELDIDLDAVASDNISKLLSRKERDLIHGSGDNR